MTVLENYLKPHAAALQLRQQRMEVLASNIANAATPNYKARDIDFASEYSRALSGMGSLASTNKVHLTTVSGGPTEMLYRQPISPSPDGNTVELHVEQLQFAENGTRYEATLQFLGERIRGLRSALRGE
jgi:flagellar basal-body rod protein FlgB